ncbi:MAG: TIGR04076 family protein [Spirochaetales bacterium]|nr:TIGR04076 family protein [Spirochaetales bacterium]
MVCVKITVVKRSLHGDLADKYCGHEVVPCGIFTEGQSYITGMNKPEGFCDWAWNDIFKGVLSVFAGGSFNTRTFQGWMKKPDSVLLCCSDALRPVSFLIERVDTRDLMDLSGVENALPVDAYESERWGEFSYTLQGLSKGKSYTVRLHFAEVYFTAAGKRRFGIEVNGKPFLSEFDICAGAGKPYLAIIKDAPATADANGTIRIDFIKGSADFPKVNAIEVFPAGSADASPVVAINAGGPSLGTLSADRCYDGGNATGIIDSEA